MLTIQFELFGSDDCYWNHHYVGHMTLTGEAGCFISAYPSKPHLGIFWIFDALQRLMNGMETLLSDEVFPLEQYLKDGVGMHGELGGPPIVSSGGKKTFVLDTELDSYAPNVWFVKKADGTIDVRALPESDAWEDAMTDSEEMEWYRDMLRSRDQNTWDELISTLNGGQLIEAVAEGLIAFADSPGEQAIERKDEDGFHESLIEYIRLQSYIARCLEL